MYLPFQFYTTRLISLTLYGSIGANYVFVPQSLRTRLFEQEMFYR